MTFALPSNSRIAVAMSGGVDSSVVAALAVEAGLEVVGLTLQLYDQGASAARPGACCAGADIADARRICAQLGIAHYVIDRESAFRASVIDDFADSYVRGETPIPCVRCNQSVKFTDLVSIARDLGAAALATGHYARRYVAPSGLQLLRAIDGSRDQSYFLFATTSNQLAYLRLPLGDLRKTDVRALAERFALPVASKPDSQDICFVPGGRYADLVRKLRPQTDAPGEIVDRAGRVLGHHAGLIDFTVGQRRGLGIGGEAEPLYVLRLEPETRRVVVGPYRALGVSGAVLGETSWVEDVVPTPGVPIEARVRSTAQPVPATMTGPFDVRFAAPEHGVSPGQACVLSQGDRVLGGGFIVRTVPAEVAYEAAA